jgi:peptidylprolyl isomerase
VSTDLSKKPVVTLPSGPRPTALRTNDVVTGSGQIAVDGATVKVHYLGLFYQDGEEFDSSWSRGTPAEFSLARVIPGFAQGIEGMKVGGRREIVIPAALGYADAPPPGFPKDADLIFVVDLLDIVE